MAINGEERQTLRRTRQHDDQIDGVAVDDIILMPV
jgi:hypothetical protein